MNRTCSTHRRDEKYVHNFNRKRPEIRRSRWKNIKMHQKQLR
jgi:hypothetical protein